MLSIARTLGISGTVLRNAATVVALALIVRMIVLIYIVSTFGETGLMTGDGTHYKALADSVLDGNGYVYDGVHDMFRAPGYPAFFMLLRTLGLSLSFGSMIQIVCAALICGWVVWFASTRLRLSDSAAFVAGCVAAFEPILVYYSVVFLPDVFFAMLALAAFTWMLRWFETGALRYVVIAGVAIGAANYVRTVLLYLPYMLSIMIIVYAWWHARSRSTAALAAAAVIIVPLLIMGPWSLHNQRIIGTYAFVGTSDYTFFSYGAILTQAVYQGVPYQTLKPQMMAEAMANAPDPNPASFKNAGYFRQQAIAVIREHPFIFIRQYMFGLGTFWAAGNYQYIFTKLGFLAPPSESVSYSMLLTSKGFSAAFGAFVSKLSQPFIVVALIDRVLWLCAFLLSLVGLYRFRKTVVGWLIAVFFVYFSITILATIIGVEARHRYALNPILIPLVVSVCVWIYTRLKQRYAART